MIPERCPACGERRDYDETCDACYCASCDQWLEPKCKDPDCEYCLKRPDRPSEVPEVTP